MKVKNIKFIQKRNSTAARPTQFAHLVVCDRNYSLHFRASWGRNRELGDIVTRFAVNYKLRHYSTDSRRELEHIAVTQSDGNVRVLLKWANMNCRSGVMEY